MILRAHVDEQELQELKLADQGAPPLPYSYTLTSYKRDYINKVLAAAKAYDIAGLDSWSVPSARDDVEDIYINFTAAVDHFTTQVRNPQRTAQSGEFRRLGWQHEGENSPLYPADQGHYREGRLARRQEGLPL